jgi:hypothetical protein
MWIRGAILAPPSILGSSIGIIGIFVNPLLAFFALTYAFTIYKYHKKER